MGIFSAVSAFFTARSWLLPLIGAAAAGGVIFGIYSYVSGINDDLDRARAELITANHDKKNALAAARANASEVEKALQDRRDVIAVLGSYQNRVEDQQALIGQIMKDASNVEAAKCPAGDRLIAIDSGLRNLFTGPGSRDSETGGESEGSGKPVDTSAD